MRARPTYFFTMTVLFLVIVVLGFAPSFYLKFLVPSDVMYPDGLPVPHIVHGVILTVWYVFLVVQAGLVRTGGVRTHMRLGWFGAGWAILVLASTAWVIGIFPRRMQQLAAAQGTTVDEVEPGLASILWLDLFKGILFVLFTALAIVKRRVPAVHKRLMLYSGIVFLFAATSRLAGTIDQLAGLGIAPLPGHLMLLCFTASLLVYDRRTLGRVLPVSWWCFGLYWALFLLSFVIGGIPAGVGVTRL